MSTDTSFIRSWWFSHRLEYNKALLFTWLIGSVIQAVGVVLRSGAGHPGEILNELVLSGMFVILFLILANLAFTIGSIINVILGHKIGLVIRQGLFIAGYWLSIAMLILLMIDFFNEFYYQR